MKNVYNVGGIIRILYYLPIERMNSAINVREAELMEVIRINNSVIKQLEEENKKLKEYWSIEINTCNRYREKSEQLEEENEDLKLKIEELEKEIDRLNLLN